MVSTRRQPTGVDPSVNIRNPSGRSNRIKDGTTVRAGGQGRRKTPAVKATGHQTADAVDGDSSGRVDTVVGKGEEEIASPIDFTIARSGEEKDDAEDASGQGSSGNDMRDRDVIVMKQELERFTRQVKGQEEKLKNIEQALSTLITHLGNHQNDHNESDSGSDSSGRDYSIEQEVVDIDDELVGNHESREIIQGLEFCGMSRSEALYFVKRTAITWNEVCQISSVGDVVKAVNKARGRQMIGPRVTTRLSVFVHWARRIQMKKLRVFKVQEFASSYESHYATWSHSCAIKDKDNKIPVPPTLDPKKWKEWLRATLNYLSSLYNDLGVPLIYVVWEMQEFTEDQHSESGLLDFYKEIRMSGPTFEADTLRVHRIISSCLSDSEAYAWVAKEVKGSCGRRLLKALSDHYDGEVSMVNRAQQALSTIKGASWSHEYTYSFERYSKKLKEAFDDLARAKRPKTGVEKVEILLDNMKDNTPDISFAMNTVRSSEQYRENFMAAVDFLKRTIERVYPPRDSRNTGGRRNVSQLNSGDKGKWPNSWKGVDISNWNREYTKDEWDKLPVKLRKAIAKSPGRKKKRDEWNQNNSDKTKSNESSGTPAKKKTKYVSWKKKIASMESDDRVEISAGDLQSMLGDHREEYDDSSHEDVKKEGNRYVFKATVTKKDSNSTSSGQKLVGTRTIGRLRSGPRRFIKSSTTNKSNMELFEGDGLVGHIGQVDCDNHADTCCLGSSFRLIAFTNQVCSVTGFMEGMEESNVPIVTGATRWTSPKGDSYILIVHQGLWFGSKLERSLINSNQIRHNGIRLCDDPFDPHRALGIEVIAEDNLFVPMYMDGSTATFETCCPSDEELKMLPHIILTSEQVWDPSSNLFPKYHKDEVERQVLSGEVVCVSQVTSSNHRMEWILPNGGLDVEDNIYSNEEMVQKLVSDDRKLAVCAISSGRHHKVDEDSLASKWMISRKAARRTLDATTQLGLRSARMPLSRRYRPGELMLRHHQRLNASMYTDTLKGPEASHVGNRYAQLFTGSGVTYLDACKRKSDVHIPLKNFLHDVGHPMNLVYDNSKEQVCPGTEFQNILRKLPWIKSHNVEDYTPNQNFAEHDIGILKRKIRARRVKRNIPQKLWDFHAKWEAEILSRTVRGNNDRTGMEMLTGETPDISEWVDFEFYDLVWFWYQPGKEDNPVLGRWLGVSHRIGSQMCYWVIDRKGRIHSRTTVQHALDTDFTDPASMKDKEDFDAKLSEVLKSDTTDDQGFSILSHEDEHDTSIIKPAEGEIFKQDAEDEDPYTNYGYDELVNAEFMVRSHDGTSQKATVRKRLRDDDGVPLGTYHPNPLMNTAKYEVQKDDGTVEAYNANTIVENILSQMSPDGSRITMFEGILDHCSDDTAIDKADAFIRSGNRMTHKKTTRGWKLLVEWKDGTVDWVPLAELKGSHPVEVAEYAKAAKIADEPAFAWWVPHVLRKKARIIEKVKSRYWKTTHKFGIRLPHSVEEALQIDKETGTDFWAKAIQKEMQNVLVAFKFLDITVEEARSGKVLVGHQEIKCHMIFDIKMDGMFTRKARFVAGGHTVDKPMACYTYSSVVARDSVRIAFLIAALNGLEISSTDIGNAYLNAKCGEKIWTVAGPEFGEDKGKVMLIERALYGLSTSGKQWRDMLSETLIGLGYECTQADEDVYIKRNHKPNGEPYYEMVLCYVDDLLHISHEPCILMDKLSGIFRLKNGYGTPDRYLGATIEKVSLEGGECWSMSCNEYISNAVKNLEEELRKSGKQLRGTKSSKRPYPTCYRPELDVSPELDEIGANKFQQLIGILRWAIELGRLDIYAEVSMLSQYQCSPREGHLEAIYYIFSYLKHHPTCGIVFSHLEHQTPKYEQRKVDWGNCYPGAAEELPPKMPEPLGRPVIITCYVDADHAGNLFNRRSHSGIIIYVNDAPILWFSKRQNTVEASSFGSEFNALRIALEMIEGLRYKLRMFGIPCSEPAVILCDNKSVVTNSSNPESVLKKRHNAICYHRVREAAAAGYINVIWIEGKLNIADVFTKTTITSDQRKYCLRRMLRFTDTPAQGNGIIKVVKRRRFF